jgi:hypothetical protein
MIDRSKRVIEQREAKAGQVMIDRKRVCDLSTYLAIRGTRRPSSACWPSRQLICEKLTFDPFAPDIVISARLLCGNGFF